MTLSARSPAVVAFVAAFEENQNVAGHPMTVVASDRRKYIAIDEVDRGATPPYYYRNGRFLVDRADGRVYAIRGYGQRGEPIGSLVPMALRYREATRTFDPSSRMHVRMGRSGLATTEKAELRAAFMQHGRPRTRRSDAGVKRGPNAAGRHAAAPHRHTHARRR